LKNILIRSITTRNVNPRPGFQLVYPRPGWLWHHRQHRLCRDSRRQRSKPNVPSSSQNYGTLWSGESDKLSLSRPIMPNGFLLATVLGFHFIQSKTEINFNFKLNENSFKKNLFFGSFFIWANFSISFTDRLCVSHKEEHLQKQSWNYCQQISISLLSVYCGKFPLGSCHSITLQALFEHFDDLRKINALIITKVIKKNEVKVRTKKNEMRNRE